MNVWDLHCDTLSALRHAQNEGKEVLFEKNPSMQIDLDRLRKGNYLLQCFACFVNLETDRSNPLAACMEMTDIFYRLLDRYPELMQIRTPEDIRRLSGSGKIGAMLTVEEGAVCLDDVRILRNLYRLGVRMMTFTWNHENGLASPNNVPGDADTVWPCSPVTDKGLKDKGFEFLAEMERLHMIADVSHLSDKGILDVLKAAKRPFAASHSNARSVCGHVRNLTDEMIREMGGRGCLIGLNYCASFLDPCMDRTKVRSRVRFMVQHIRHIMNVGGEDILALGSDFDGIEGDLEIASAKDLPRLAEGLSQEGFSDREIEKIFYGNAMRFFEENL